MTNKFNMTLLNFSTRDYSGRSFYRYTLTKLILGDDYDPDEVVKNIDTYTGFYKDGTLGQEILFYFIEIYCYDRYNFFFNMANEQYLLLGKVNKDTDIKDTDIKNKKINELLKNKLWISEYPPIDGIIYLDKSNDDGREVSGIETVIFIPDIFLKKIDDIYINDGKNFKSKIKDVSELNPKLIDFNSLFCYLKNLNSHKQKLIGGGYYDKYKKYKNKYLSLKNNF